MILVSVGRAAQTRGIGLEAAGVELTPQGQIVVDDLLRTANPRIWAAGDCIGGLQLAHLASAEGARAVENALGVEVRPIDRTVVPSCIYTHPEIAMVGLGVEAARAAGYEVQVGQARFLGNGKALGEDEPDGLVQLCSEAGTGRILGATVMGVHAVEIIHEVGVAISDGLTAGGAGRHHSCASHGQRAGDGGGGAGRGPRPLPELTRRRRPHRRKTRSRDG